ncbi:hypothetical protein TWF694_003736 [Orbilia ellipsospora]|uniref:Uncharacterized protein n=1 Tax=Orbilia ellipsospora TaxID=2528407 RepID=A0AAV9WZX3_9PEZI
MAPTLVESQSPTTADCPGEPISSSFKLPKFPPWDQVRDVPDLNGQPSTEQRPFSFDAWCSRVAPDLFDPTYADSMEPKMFSNPHDDFTPLSPEAKYFSTGMENALRLIRTDITRFRNELRRVYALIPEVQTIVFGTKRKDGPLDNTIPALMLTIRRLMASSTTRNAINMFRETKTWPSKREEADVRKILNCSYAFMLRFTNLWHKMGQAAEYMMNAKRYQERAIENLQHMEQIIEKRRLTIDYLQIMYERECQNLTKRLQECEGSITDLTMRFKYEFSSLATKFATGYIIPHVVMFNVIFGAYWKTVQKPKGIQRLRGLSLRETLSLTPENMREVHWKLAVKFGFVPPGLNDNIDEDDDGVSGSGSSRGPNGTNETNSVNGQRVNGVDGLHVPSKGPNGVNRLNTESIRLSRLSRKNLYRPAVPRPATVSSERNKRNSSGDQDGNPCKGVSLGDFLFSDIDIPRM